MSGLFYVVGMLTIIFAGRADGLVIDESVNQAYEDVRDDSSPISWAVCTYEDKRTISLLATGSNYDEFLGLLDDDIRAYAYVRFEMGDEMSRRAKFAFITWIGPGVSPLKKAKVSTDKAFVKEIFNQFGKEILADEKADLKFEKVKKILEAASGAAYGTGQ